MQEIKLLLDKVLLEGDEQAFHDFCLARQNPEIVSPFLGALKYIHAKASNMPEKLDQCYPEMLIELAYFLRNIYATLEHDQSVISFINYIKRAAKNNDGAKAALFILIAKHKSILTTAELQALIAQVKSIEQATNLNKHQLYLLGTFYFFDDVNSVEALKYIEAAAKMSHAFAMNCLGAMHGESKTGKELSEEMRNKEAFEWFQKAAASGCVVAMNNLGKMYVQGNVGKELSEEARNKEAFDWFKKAAAFDYAPAITNLGLMYLRNKAGKEVSEEVCNKAAFNLFKKAGALGHAEARYNLGAMVVQGRAVTPSTAQEQNLEPSTSLRPPILAGVAEIPLNELSKLQQKIIHLEQTVMNLEGQVKSRDSVIQLLTERLQPSVPSNTQAFFQSRESSVVEGTEQEEFRSQTAISNQSSKK